MTGKVGSAVMSESDNNNSTPVAGGDQPVQSPRAGDTAVGADGVTSPNAGAALPSSASTPEALHSGLTHSPASTPNHNRLIAGPRAHPVHGDRPSSAPPHHLERLSGVILRTMGDNYQSSTYGQTLRMIGDQMAFENEIRRALSYSDLDRLQNNENR